MHPRPCVLGEGRTRPPGAPAPRPPCQDMGTARPTRDALLGCKDFSSPQSPLPCRGLPGPPATWRRASRCARESRARGRACAPATPTAPAPAQELSCRLGWGLCCRPVETHAHSRVCGTTLCSAGDLHQSFHAFPMLFKSPEVT